MSLNGIFGVIGKIILEVVLARLVLVVITLLSAVIFINSPWCKATFKSCISLLQTAPAVVASTALPKLSEEELPAPPLNSEADLAAPKEEPPPVAAEAGPDDTFERVMDIYDKDMKEQDRERAQRYNQPG